MTAPKDNDHKKPRFEPEQPMVLSAEKLERLMTEGTALRRNLEARIASMEVLAPSALPVRSR